MSTTNDTESVATDTLEIDPKAIAAFQIGGIFFLLFYYSELLFVLRNRFLPNLRIGEWLDSFFLVTYEIANSGQRELNEYFPEILAASLFGVLAVYVLILVTSLRRFSDLVFIRAVFFLCLGLCAIPAVLVLWTLRWLPEYLFSVLASIYNYLASWVGPVVAFIAPYLGYLFLATIGLFALLLLLSTRIGRWVLGTLTVALAGLYFAGLEFFPALEAIRSFGGTVGEVLSYPISWGGYVLSFLIAVLSAVLFFVVVVAVCMVVISQFGHIFLDTLFDARNVRRSAVAAGRFLVGIGFLASTVILCFPENKLAAAGATDAVLVLIEQAGQSATRGGVEAIAVSLVDTYLLLIPDSVQPAVTKAFSYGYPPSLELILLTVACGVAFYLIAVQVFRREAGGTVALAFYPKELIFLFIYASIVLLAVMFAADVE
ncbi:hypothetical protein [Sedimenticola sp.]|uniref:hypothetical protein n=1 Tax=Sedimenticola sp. TaxID=1940285 RepID=UPI003D09EA39